MARSLIQRRQEAERARVDAYEASLRRVSQRARSAPDFHKAIAEARDGFEAAVVRDPWAWRPQMKTRDAARLRLAAARYLFARYPVAEHLEQIWVDRDGLDRDEVARLAEPGDQLMVATAHHLVDLADPASAETAIQWWGDLTGRGGPGCRRSRA